MSMIKASILKSSQLKKNRKSTTVISRYTAPRYTAKLAYRHKFTLYRFFLSYKAFNQTVVLLSATHFLYKQNYFIEKNESNTATKEASIMKPIPSQHAG